MTVWNQQPLQQNMETEQMDRMSKAKRAQRLAKVTTELKLEAPNAITLADLDEVLNQTAGWDRNTIVSVTSRSVGQRDESYVHTISIIEGRLAR
ncbi:hypothetical protein [Rhodococcus sp. MALMAid1271]|uniref:hypothetical protein n=1 Tax=Rhodococcus sp. MALMAid1271 TaxID=3411744 RepID=UPI003BA0A448